MERHAFKRQKLDVDGSWQRNTIPRSTGADPAPASAEPHFLLGANSTSTTITSSPGPYTPTHLDFQARKPNFESPEPPHSSYQIVLPYGGIFHENCSRNVADGNVCQIASSSENNDGSSLVCFGMFVVKNVRSARQRPHTSLDCFPVEVRSVQIYEAPDATRPPHDRKRPLRVGQITCDRTADVLRRLEDARDVTLEYYCRGIRSQSRRMTKRCTQAKEYELLVNVFGNENLAEEFGIFFDKLAIYLQDPVICTRIVPYRNPHLLSQDDDVVMTSSLRRNTDIESFSAPADVFDTLLRTGSLPEAECPAMLQTRLLSHQRQALYFMRRSEGTSCVGDSPHQMWTETRAWSTGYTNAITGESQCSRPKDFSGGLIADQMGLGKTLQMISLVASDHDANSPMQLGHELPAPMTETYPPARSLVVVPTTLLQTWQDQLREHLKPGSIRWRVYHGSHRQNAQEVLASYHVVLTTYDIVASEYRKTLNQTFSSFSTPIFSSAWRRIILDEAHYIRNLSALRTKAVCAIEARSRWAVTGTPIQNRLSDLVALVHFLRVEPFNNPSVFDQHIIQPWKSRSDLKAVQKLRRLIESIAIRRPKDTLALPDRIDQIRHVNFDSGERSLYEKVRLRIRDNALSSNATPKPNHILRWINELRGLCSHGQINADPNSTEGLEDPLADGNISPDINATIEPNPMDALSVADLFHADFPEGVTSNSIDEYGSGCPGGNLIRDLGPNWRPGHRQNPQDPSSGFLSPVTKGNSPSASSSDTNEDGKLWSSKMLSLVSDLRDHDGKAVVFSFWRTTLDLAGQALDEAGLAFKRIDGTMSGRDREWDLSSFRNDPSVKVLLATISAAGVGLDLTVANLACILEPQWNPSVEEQALSRVHRMRQTKPVKTIRYVIRDSIEENIIELQQRKLRLAQLALSRKKDVVGTGLMEDLKVLLK
ncbi:hypothetical protein PV04_05332 [Phialophora macrospora]|uniref:Helicase ATP-binding domain-containing protein n=1 Tax=Phialophora macrospora TaxID=1851006 RepID=A0A0D2FSE1_9EURO|nr:hypothetical protein PV04_05332 [Phialophora macrospora]